MMRLKLYSYWRSSCSWRVRIALVHKHLTHDIEPVNLVADGGEQNQPAHRQRNPLGQVPVLEVEEQGRVRYISQSLAILGFLEDRFSEFALLPDDSYQRAAARQLAEMVNAGIQPLQNSGTMRYLGEQLGQDPVAWSKHWIARGLAAFEESSRPHRRRFCVGDKVSWADLCLIPQLFNARRFGLDLSGLDALVEIEARCAELPAFQQAHAEVQPDAPSS
ncbi:maleylacetoacetate isomerase [Haliangium sp.]|uniref:maleylacetoacetate isomerase n=1 Tax=Haliangium sp. TaxID=2663208 RepID=UPI003D0E7FF0